MKNSKYKVLVVLLIGIMLVAMGTSMVYASDEPALSADEATVSSSVEGELVQDEVLEEVVEEVVEDEVIAKITAIEIRGNVRVDTNSIRNAMKTQVGDILTYNGIIEDLNAIYELGWFEGITPDFASYMDGARYIIYVQELSKVSNISVTGNTVVSTEAILGVLKTETDKIMNLNTLNEDSLSISGLYQENDYFCAVDIVPSSSGEVVFNIIELKVGEVGIRGNEKTKSDIILAELKLAVGDYLRVSVLTEDLRMLYMTGAFEEPEPEINFIQGTADQVSVIYLLKEAKSGSANTGITFSMSEGITGYLEIGSTNLFGRLEQANIKASLSNTSIDYDLSFVVPWFINSKNSLSISLGDSRTEWETTGKYTINGVYDNISIAGRTSGGSITYGRALKVNTVLSTTFKINKYSPRIKNTANSAEIEQALADTDYLKDSLNISIGLGISHDTRDNTTSATKGYTLKASTELGFVKVVDQNSKFTNYLKFGGTATIYHTLFKNNVLAGRISVGTALKELNANQKYYVGGSETVRGYNFGQLKGDSMIYINIEDRFKIADSFHVVFFVDAGYAWDKGTIVDFGDILFSYGMGIRVNVPFLGTIRLDYAFNKEGQGQPSFSFGHMF